MSLWRKHQIFEKNSIFLLIGVLVVISIGGLVEVAAALLSEEHHRKSGGHAALHAAGTRWPQHLRARGLL